MKFLIIIRGKDLFYTLPPEKQFELKAGQAAFTDKYLKAGKCKEVYCIDDLKGGMAIWDIESTEEGARLFLENPMFPFQDYEIHTILEWDTCVKVMMEAREKLVKK